MNKFKCVIIDDIGTSIKIVENHIKKIPYLEIVAIFSKSPDWLEFLKEN